MVFTILTQQLRQIPHLDQRLRTNLNSASKISILISTRKIKYLKGRNNRFVHSGVLKMANIFSSNTSLKLPPQRNLGGVPEKLLTSYDDYYDYENDEVRSFAIVFTYLKKCLNWLLFTLRTSRSPCNALSAHQFGLLKVVQSVKREI